MSLREASVYELRRILSEELNPRRISVTRGVNDSILLKILSESLEGVSDPQRYIRDLLVKHELRLPERTLMILKSPSELEEEEEEELLFSSQRISAPTWGDALLLEPDSVQADDRSFNCRVVAFWGLKGGVGRTTALSHVSSIVGRRQQKVLAVDLDLEAPGLVATLTGEVGDADRPRFENLVRMAASKETSDEELRSKISRALRNCRDTGSQVEVLGPACADTAFVLSLLGPLSPSALYRGGIPTLRRLIREAISASQANIVLIDARSGYCDESAMSVLDLADEVVLFASPAPSTFTSLFPAVEALERNRRVSGRPGLVHVVAGMLPAGQEARERVLNELQAVLESARAFVNGILGTLAEDLPPDISVISVDYSPRIVENEGSLLPNASEGYREIADRLMPAPLPATVTKVEPGFVASILREAQVPVAQAESEEDPEALADLFTRTPDLEKFSRHDVCLVLGAKGTGKSYLRRMCLEHQDLLVRRSGVQSLKNALFIDGYSQPRHGRAASPPISQDLLEILHGELGDKWKNVWSVLSLGRAVVAIKKQVGSKSLDMLKGKVGETIHKLSEASSPKQVAQHVRSLVKFPLELDEFWQKLEDYCERLGKTIVLLFDDLDVALGESEEGIRNRASLISGLLDRANASWMSRKHLGIKIFLREDVFRSLEMEEGAKYITRSVVLHWRPDDIWRLVIRAMSVASPLFRAHLEERGLDIDRLEDASEEDIRLGLILIWGERLGAGESHTRTTTWASSRLRDGNGRMFPRAALWLLKYGLEERRRRIGDSPDLPILDGRSLRSAMPKVSEQRLAELKKECTPRERERIMLLKNFPSYQNEDSFLESLKRAGEKDPAEAMGKLKDLGLLEMGARRDGTPTVRIVDLYAFAPELSISRMGRR